ncbi:MAG: type VI secretion system tip protein TssI/VgrG [Polyangiaceae bacterium]
MSIDVFAMECDALDGAKLAGFKGVEVLNRPFEFDVFFTVPVGTDVRRAVGARATLTVDRADDRGPMCWRGILAAVRLLHETGERALYRASLVPKLWLLGQHVRSFVHTKKKIDAYVRDTLKDGGLTGADFAFKTNAGAYPEEEFVCQYRESHLDFVHRWFEREGLYYYFEHPEGAGAAEKLVIVDDRAQHSPLLGDGHVRYFPAAGADGSAGECLRELHADFKLLPASVLVTDYNYANPNAPVAGEKPVMSGGQGKIREYGYRVFTEGEAKRLAQVKAQSMACRELVLSASGTYLGLRAGYTFVVDEGPSDLPSKYLAIEVRHAGVVSGAAPLVMRYTGLDAKETYRVDVTAIPSDVQYRAPQVTAWPRIYGFENGTIDGPGESQYAQIDDMGRYLVRFKFDASELPDGSTSTYLRMMQPHGGSTEGFHFPLRKGTEVMVSFQGGDPDRPVIAGVVPNVVTPSNVTNRNNRQNVLQTGSGNYLVMDDTKDREYIDMGVPGGNPGGGTYFYIGDPAPDQPPGAAEWPPRSASVPQAPGVSETRPFSFSYFTEAENGVGFDVGGDWWQSVGGALFLDVTSEVRIRYGAEHLFIVIGPSTETYEAQRTTNMNASYVQNIKPSGEQNVTGTWKHTVTGTSSDDYGTWNTQVKGAWTAHMGSVTITSDGPIQIDAPRVTISGANVQTKTALQKWLSGPSIEFYTLKESAGIQKLDICGISASVAQYASSYAGVKGETAPAAKLTFGALFKQAGADFVSAGILIGRAAVHAKNAAMHIIG